ncbi:2-amino-4-hydroxy-6-hydroxymethyldihydropteridine diphosphokinase [Limibacter armeniacum]|uniref:2-amino-4-hydroxy-6- hydroxymethyldihydropteridine diphosphokinase n=1 Tax=Limibacter armeniacum TaxID=466084 RepID=UPI002FE546E3
MKNLKTAYILLGGNLGDRMLMLDNAQKQIAKLAGEVVKVSGDYETAAWGVEDQPSFFNRVLAIQTDKEPMQLLETLQQIELDLGRERHVKWGARLIDIDILFYEDEVIDLPRLKVPHPFLHERRFTLVPLAEIAENYLHPVLKKSVSALLECCPDELEVQPLKSVQAAG